MRGDAFQRRTREPLLRLRRTIGSGLSNESNGAAGEIFASATRIEAT